MILISNCLEGIAKSSEFGHQTLAGSHDLRPSAFLELKPEAGKILKQFLSGKVSCRTLQLVQGGGNGLPLAARKTFLESLELVGQLPPKN